MGLHRDHLHGGIDDAVLRSLPQVIAGLPQSVATDLLGRCRTHLTARPDTFNRLYRELDTAPAPAASPLGAFDPETNRTLGDAATALRERGIYIWRGFYNPQVVEAVKAVVELCVERGRQWLKTAPDEPTQAPDPDLGCEHWGHSQMPLQGRTRCFFRSGTPPKFDILTAIMQDARLWEVGNRFYGVRPHLNGLLCEELVNAPLGDHWHIDGILDQYKVMVLLEDADQTQGPLHFKPGTHKLLDTSLNPMLHSSFSHGRDWGCYPYYRTVEGLGIDTVLGTGQAGDAIFFDTLNIHSGSICQQDRRLGMNAYFSVSTPKNRLLQLVSGGLSL